MPDFLELVQTYNRHDATIDRLYGNEGYSCRGTQDQHFREALLRTVQFLDAFQRGRVSEERFREAMSTSDFPLLFGAVIDSQILAAYREWAPTWRSIARVSTVRDFRSVERGRDPLGGDTRLDEVHELEEYKAASLTEQAPFTWKVKKYGRRIPFSWETMINDVRNRLRDMPERLGRAARRTEQYFATSLYVSSTGPSSTVYSNANKNIVNVANGAATNNPALSILGLQDAFTVLARQTDPVTGEPIMLEAAILEVPPALTIVAQNILNATQLIIGADSDDQRIITNNWMRNHVTLVVNPSLATINTTSGNTSWYLHAAATSDRPLLEVGFLAGREAPEIFVKSPNAMRVGGGLVDPLVGDFDTDTIEYKLRHVFGGVVLDPRSSVASNGTGT